ncbi:hypothetical protein [Methylococcus capsulatus]|uniref:hypothetical protein n=1 Tax=Methylococcus capsulatus TaxID=414 RepID=UPI001C533FAC|nr:hypothetical protein [Methylococcus capsulatus]QXP90023.1 hypothetical protein KW114_13310 [Methylococcus capsulatus]
MSTETRSIFIRLDKTEADKVRALSREYHFPMEEVIRRMVVISLEQLEAEAKAAEDLPAGERQRRAYVEAVKDWEAEF